MPGNIRKYSKKSNQGFVSKKKGAEFELRLEQGALQTGGYPIKIADGARRVGLPGPPYHRYIPQKQPFDYIVVYGDKIIFLDCKSTSFKTVPKSSKMLKDHQIKNLKILNDAAVAGFLFFFENETSLGKVIFFNVDQVINLQRGSSLKPDDGVYLGDITNFDLRILLK